MHFQFILTGNTTYEILVCSHSNRSYDYELIDHVNRVLGYDTNESVNESPLFLSANRPHTTGKHDVQCE